MLLKKRIFLIVFLVTVIFSFSSDYTFKMGLGDYFLITGYNGSDNYISGQYTENDEFFIRSDGSFKDYDFLNSGDTIKLRFSDDITEDSTVLFFDHYAENNEMNLDYMLDIINGAQKFVYVSCYDIDNKGIINALVNASSRGIDVKVVVEASNRNNYTDFKFPKSGIKVIYDMNSALMHDKFIIVDGYCIMTGSTNFTENGLKKNSNNTLIIFSNVIAQYYMDEFSEQFYDLNFGKKFTQNTGISTVKLKTGDFDVYFTPEDDFRSEIVDLIDNAVSNINVMIFTFTDQEIADALIRAENRGVKVRTIMETYQASSQWSVYNSIKNEFDVVLDKNPDTFHYKTMIIDNEIIITGSFNFTNAAQEKNDENALVIHSSKIAESYNNEFEKLYKNYTENKK